MKLNLYLLALFLPILLGALGFFSLVIVLIDFLMNLWKYIQNGVSPSQMLKIMFLYLPKTVWYALPLATLFAVSHTLSSLYANNELVAVFATGVSLLDFTKPLLILSFFMSIGLFFFDDKIVTPLYAQKNSLQAALLHEEEQRDNENIVISSEGGRIVYLAEYYDDASKTLSLVTVIFRDEKKNLTGIIKADFATWDANMMHWSLDGAVFYKKEGESLIIDYQNAAEKIRLLNEDVEAFRRAVVNVEEVSAKEAKAYIKRLEKNGTPHEEELATYYKKFSFPFVLFIVVFLSIGLSGKSRKNVLIISLSLSVMSAVAFYVLQMITMLLAKFGYISPFFGAWSAVIIFIFLSILLLHFART